MLPAKPSPSSSIGTESDLLQTPSRPPWKRTCFGSSGTGEIEADRVVALPRIEGLRLPGVPHDTNGFVPIDEHGRVRGVDDVYAAGDLTTFRSSRAGSATQQADAAAESIAAAAGAEITPPRSRRSSAACCSPASAPRFMRAELGSLRSELDTEPLWWPPGKIVGRYLAPFLASELHVSQSLPAPMPSRSRSSSTAGRTASGVDLNAAP